MTDWTIPHWCSPVAVSVIYMFSHMYCAQRRDKPGASRWWLLLSQCLVQFLLSHSAAVLIYLLSVLQLLYIYVQMLYLYMRLTMLTLDGPYAFAF